MSRVALIVAGLYFVIAASVMVTEAASPPSGGWITLRYMGSFLATFPVSAPLSKFGFQPDFNNRFIAALLLASCTGLIYTIVALIGALLCRVLR